MGSGAAGSFEGRRVEKPWGYELIWAQTEHYAGKILHVDAGRALSLQYHEEKDETMYVLRGEALAEIGDSRDTMQEHRLVSGQSLHLPPKRLHRLSAITDCDILEVSTPELDDVVRLADHYGRAGTKTP